MPELPDVCLYIESLRARLVARRLTGIRLKSPFLLRSVEPAMESLIGLQVQGVQRIGKRIVLAFEEELFLVLHLMIAGRLRWGKPGAGLPGRIGLAALDFEEGSLLITEAGSKKRAALHVVRGEAALAEHDPGGIEPLEMSLQEFQGCLQASSHTLKRTLTDPRILSGIGNAYSDEILHHARLSPFKRASKLGAAEAERLWCSIGEVLRLWITRLAEQTGDAFPTKVTAFRPEMSVHGRYGEACPVCQSVVQRILYESTETNYCPGCQNGGKLFKDRVLSRLLKESWPKDAPKLGPGAAPEDERS